MKYCYFCGKDINYVQPNGAMFCCEDQIRHLLEKDHEGNYLGNTIKTTNCNITSKPVNIGCDFNHLSDAIRYFIGGSAHGKTDATRKWLQMSGRSGIGKAEFFKNIKNMIDNKELEMPRMSYQEYIDRLYLEEYIDRLYLGTSVSLKEGFGKCYGNRKPLVCNHSIGFAYNKLDLEKFSNLKPDYMTNESLTKGMQLQRSINDKKSQIESVEECSFIASLTIRTTTSHRQVDSSYVDFTSLKKSILAKMKKELSEMEKEFAKL